MHTIIKQTLVSERKKTTSSDQSSIDWGKFKLSRYTFPSLHREMDKYCWMELKCPMIRVRLSLISHSMFKSNECKDIHCLDIDCSHTLWFAKNWSKSVQHMSVKSNYVYVRVQNQELRHIACLSYTSINLSLKTYILLVLVYIFWTSYHVLMYRGSKMRKGKITILKKVSFQKR